jgi:hypothetical protein
MGSWTERMRSCVGWQGEKQELQEENRISRKEKEIPAFRAAKNAVGRVCPGKGNQYTVH